MRRSAEAEAARPSLGAGQTLAGSQPSETCYDSANVATFFNNSSARNHRGIYPVPFFDLNIHGRHETMATGLQPGAECVVATPGESGDIMFQWFSFAHEQVMPDEKGEDVRVFYGRLLSAESMPKAVAAQHERYGVFFDVNGHFKRASVVGPKD